MILVFKIANNIYYIKMSKKFNFLENILNDQKHKIKKNYLMIENLQQQHNSFIEFNNKGR